MANDDLDDLDTGFSALIGCGLSDPCAGETMGKFAADGRNGQLFTLPSWRNCG
jgi:hypothetical protein